MIIVYRKNIVVVTWQWITIFRYKLSAEDGHLFHKWIAKNDYSTISGNYTAFYQARSETIEFIEMIIRQKKCKHLYFEKEEGKYTDWTWCAKCKKTLTFNNKKI